MNILKVVKNTIGKSRQYWRLFPKVVKNTLVVKDRIGNYEGIFSFLFRSACYIIQSLVPFSR